jgi:ketosteroid isomerase-like protein
MPASLELVKIALQAYGNGDSEIAIALTGPHVRWDERASRADGDLVWGHDKVQRAMRRYLDGWETYRFQLEDIAEVAPGKVVGICREVGKPKDGPAIDRGFGGLWVVEKGKIVSWTTYLTPREAVRAAKELVGPQVKRVESEPVAASVSATPAEPAPVPAVVAEPEPEPEPEPEFDPQSDPEPEPVVADSPEPVQGEASGPFDFDAPDPAPPPAGERPRKRILTKSEEQKRAARARANLRRSSRQSA